MVTSADIFTVLGGFNQTTELSYFYSLVPLSAFTEIIIVNIYATEHTKMEATFRTFKTTVTVCLV